MKSKYFLLLIIPIIIYSCKNATANEIQVVTATEMQNHLKYDNMQVVDVQPPDEYKKSHLLNARNIMYDKDFRKKLETLDKTKPVAVYCTSGKVSPEAAKILREAGFLHIYLLEGGIKKWQDEIKDLQED